MRRMTNRRSARLLALFTATAAIGALGVTLAPAGMGTANGGASTTPGSKESVAVGSGGAVSSVDPDASAAGIKVLKQGGNAVDAAVATAAALGVTEPYSAGVGGGGYFVSYDADSGKVRTLDGRETAPQSADEKLFMEDGKALPFEEAVTSGLGVGTPGTAATWEQALDKWGSKSLGKALAPAERLASGGFKVDKTFRQQTADNEKRFRNFPATVDLFMPGGKLPEVGSTMRNPDLARTYKTMARKGAGELYDGRIADDIVKTVRKPPVDPDSDKKIRSGDMTQKDLAAYKVKKQAPSRTEYRGLDVFGMAPSSSGGTTVGEALNILENGDLSKLSKKELLHRYIEASRVAFADRGRWVGDPSAEDVPTKELLSQRFADSRA
ncbi:MAG TPA: gamma-glutamyltransferase, partial [Streptomyces sp.]|nr:gamma-glutamyltransferase [Streptomyces sp.]